MILEATFFGIGVLMCIYLYVCVCMHTNLSAIILDTDDDFISREQLFFFFRVGTDIVFGS